MKHNKGEDINGWLVVDKARGVGSTDVVRRAKRLFRARKAGHAGTLDPFATGVLPVAFGEATKLLPFVTDGVKEYEDSDEIAYSYINKDKIVIAINMLYRYFIGQKDIVTIIFASSLPKGGTGEYEYGEYSAEVWIDSHNVSNSNEDLSRFLVKILEKNKWKETAREISSQFLKNKLVVDGTTKTLQFRKAAEKGDGTINYSLKINNIESDE